MIGSKIKFSKYTTALIAAWGISLLFVGIGYFLFYLPQGVELAQVQGRYSESREKLEHAQLAGQDRTREKMKLRCEESEQFIAEFSTDRDKMTELVFKIGQIANDLKLVEFSSKNENKKELSTIQKSKALDEGWLSVEFCASFNQFIAFVNQLERHCPAVFVEEVSFQRSTSSGKGHRASLKLSFLAKKDSDNKMVALAADE